MNELLSLFLPAVFAVYLYQKINKKELSNKNTIIYYLIFVLLINIASYLISIYVFKRPDFIFTNVFTFKYLILSLVIGIFFSFVISFIEKNFEITVEVDKNEK